VAAALEAAPAALNQTDTQVSLVEPKRGSRLGYAVAFLLIAVIAGGSVVALGRRETVTKVIVPVVSEPAPPPAAGPEPLPPVVEPKVEAPIVKRPERDTPSLDVPPPAPDTPVEPAPSPQPRPSATPAKSSEPTTAPVARALALLSRVNTVERRLADTDDLALKSTASKVKAAILDEAKKPEPSKDRLDTLESQLGELEANSK